MVSKRSAVRFRSWAPVCRKDGFSIRFAARRSRGRPERRRQHVDSSGAGHRAGLIPPAGCARARSRPPASPARSARRTGSTLSHRRQEPWNGQAEVRADEAARERGDDRARGPREDDADGGDHDGVVAEQSEDLGADVRLDRQRAGREGAGDHDRDGARGVRDGEAALRARGLSGARGLREEHDHGRGADGRGDPGGVGGGRADAADAGAHPAGAAGGGAVHRGVHEQGGHGGRPGAAGPGGAGGAGAAEEVRVPGGRDPGDPGLGEAGDGRAGEGRGGEQVDLRR